MANEHDTGIEWTHVPGYKGATWNPVRGCTKISPGCKNCYAETFAERWRGVIMPNGKPHAYHQGFDLRLVPELLDVPLRKQKPHAWFVNSMSDLHQDGVPHEFLMRAYAVMQAARLHLFMVLTKRPQNMSSAIWRMQSSTLACCPWPTGDVLPMPYNGPIEGPSNIWLGVSVEDRKYGLPRVDVLRTIPAAVRFLSVEPLLEDLGDIDLTGIHWVIVGGESGHGARPFAIEWAKRIVDQCREQGVPVFVKQPGDRPTFGGGVQIQVRHKSDRKPLADHGIDIREWPKCVRVPAP